MHSGSLFCWLEHVTPIVLGLTVEHVAAKAKAVWTYGATDAPSMHTNPAVQIGCTDCHGGNSEIRADKLVKGQSDYEVAKKAAHIAPKFPENWPSSANPEESYTSLLKESYEFVKFLNPGNLRSFSGEFVKVPTLRLYMQLNAV